MTKLRPGQSMIERVAIAIEQSMFAPHEFPLSDALHAKYLCTARAAIAVLHKPTKSMLIAGGERALIVWRAMIDEALIA